MVAHLTMMETKVPSEQQLNQDKTISDNYVENIFIKGQYQWPIETVKFFLFGPDQMGPST